MAEEKRRGGWGKGMNGEEGKERGREMNEGEGRMGKRCS